MALLDNTWGAVLIGTYFGIMLYGLTLHQFYRYTRLSPNDSFFIKAVVYSVVAFETFHTVLCMHMGYWYLATNYFNPVALGNGVWSVDMIPLSAASVIMASQLFFVRRVYMFGSKYRWVVYLAGLLLVIELGLLAAATAEAFHQGTFAKFEHVTWLISAGFGTAAVADVLLTTALIVTLRSSRTGWKRSDGVIEILILYAVTTGLLTTIFNILTFLFAIIYTDNLIYIGFDIVASKLYATSLLAALNSRHSIAEKGNGVSAVYGGASGTLSGGPRSGTTLSDRWRSGHNPQNNSMQMQVHIETATDLVEYPMSKFDHDDNTGKHRKDNVV
ncbi:hypothetical protein C8Q80DRAFT_1269777 [Daedaleopsis nitida]|nr:hypothetical protein C8Q80DRAFT_1269777 [Daedaleopsis nitida]